MYLICDVYQLFMVLNLSLFKFNMIIYRYNNAYKCWSLGIKRLLSVNKYIEQIYIYVKRNRSAPALR